MKPIKLIICAFRDLIIRYLPRMRKKGGFAFIVHPRNIPDVYRKYPFLKILPIPLLEWFLFHYWPVVLSEVEGMKTLDGRPVKGWVITIPLTAEQMLNDRESAKKKILQAVKLAEKMGATIAGLGAMTASLTKGGSDLIGKINIGITTGRAYTTKNIIENILSITEKFKINLEKLTIAVVGAAGGIGSACVQILATKGVKKFILVDLKKKEEQVNNLIKGIKNNFNADDFVFKVSPNVNSIYTADIIIAATNTPEVVIGPSDLKVGAVIINDAQPSDISPEIFKTRDDVLVIEGGIINTPGINYHFNFGLVNKEDTFSCLGEVLSLASINWDKNYAIGYLDLNLINDISKIASELNFQLAEFQNPEEGKISNIKMEKIKNIILRTNDLS